MISRVAEHCFWMSRYLERAENTARILDVNQTLLLDYDVPLEQQWRPLLIISGVYDMPGEAEAEAVQQYMTWEMDNLSSITASVAGARENARIIREVISAEMWERLNYYHLWMQGPQSRALYDSSRSEFYNQIKRINQLLHGIAGGTMAHGEAWEFFQLGRYLERASQTARILDVKYHVLLPTPEQVGTPVDNVHWVAILTSCSGYEPFHKKVRALVDTGTAVADFLIFDPLFPRSVSFCLAMCRKAIHAISGRPLEMRQRRSRRQLIDLASLAARHPTIADEVIRDGLHESLTRVVNRIHDIGDAIHRTYFDVRVPAIVSTAEAARLFGTPESIAIIIVRRTWCRRLEPANPAGRAVSCAACFGNFGDDRSMSIRVALNHKTLYSYDRLVTLQPHIVRLRPAPHCRTPILGYSLRVLPEPHFLNWQQDPYSNYLARIVFHKPDATPCASRSISSPR